MGKHGRHAKRRVRVSSARVSSVRGGPRRAKCQGSRLRRKRVGFSFLVLIFDNRNKAVHDFRLHSCSRPQFKALKPQRLQWYTDSSAEPVQEIPVQRYQNRDSIKRLQYRRLQGRGSSTEAPAQGPSCRNSSQPQPLEAPTVPS